MEQKIRLLRADEIECRVATVNEKGLSLLLYKDARTDQNILDEVFTPFGWKRSHQCIDGNLYCTVEIWDKEKQQWIGKTDVGTTSYAEKEKGQASDSFKRACFNWGIGRELYTAPFIWIATDKANIQRKGDKYVCFDRFQVQAIGYNEAREITALLITNSYGLVVFDYHKKEASAQTFPGQQAEQAGAKTGSPKPSGRKASAKTAVTKTALTKDQMVILEQELQRTGVAIETILQRYHIEKLEDMTGEIYARAISGLKKTESKKTAA